MKKKRKTAIAAVIIFLAQIFAVNISPLIVKAIDITDFPFITSVSIKDSNGNDLGNNIGKNDEIHLNYTWAIPNTKQVNAGDTYSMQLPSQINIIAAIDQPIYDQNTEKIADMHIGTNGAVIITFTQYASDHSNVSGNFFVDCHFKSSAIGTVNPVVISFIVPGIADTFDFNVNFKQLDPTVTKEGTYNPLTDEITWTVTVNKENVKLDNAIFEDVINLGQEFVGTSVEIDGIAASYSYDGTSHKLSSDLGSITSQKVITYKTSVRNDLATKAQGTYNYSNTAIIKYDDSGSPKSISSNVKSVPVDVKYISKSGSYNASAKQIDWTIKVNESGRTINNAIITDDIPAGLELVAGSVKIGDATADTTISDTDYTYTYTNKSSTSNFEYILGDISGVKTISYSTDVDSSVYNSNATKNFNNVVHLTGDGVPNGTSNSNIVGVTPNIIQKVGIGYDASKGIITWRITINSNETSIAAGAVVTDTIPIGQTYVANTAKFDDALIGDSGYTAATVGDTTKTGIFQYTFSNAFSKTHTLEFQTQVTDTKNYKANSSKTHYNNVNITATDINQSITGSQTATSEIISKTGADYNYATREITWKIVVNKNKMPITNAKVTDDIPAGQKYVAGSATIDDGSNGSFNSEGDIDTNGEVIYTFGSAINKNYTITIKTRLTDLSIFKSNGNKILYNTASIKGDEIPTDGIVTSKGSRTISNSVINKKSTYISGNAFIDWTLETNSNFSIPLSGATITDNLVEGLSLDTDTIELYKLIVNANGTLTNSTKVTLTKDNVSYDPTTRKFIFTFPEGSGTGAFRLKFRTDTTKTSTFSNLVEFSGSGVTQTANATPVVVWYSNGGGSGVGYNGSITVAKVDSNYDSKKLSGAVFQLLDQYGNLKTTSVATGSDGTVLFNKLKFDIDYYIKEITPPQGYNLSSEIYKFQIKDTTDGKNITYNYKDSKITGSIEFNKTGEDGNSLQGAEFSLYETTDTNFTNPLKTTTSDNNGLVKFSTVEYGSYKIKETKAPTGYNISSQIFTATISEEGKTIDANPNTVSNTKIRGSIELTKVDEEGKGIPDAEFSLYDYLDTNFTNSLKTATSDNSGVVKFSSVLYGSYKIKETKAPTGYTMSSKVVDATISENGKVLNTGTVSDIKIRGSIEVKKIGEDGRGLAGAEFSLYADSDTNLSTPLKTETSDGSGLVQFSSVEYGSYKIKETKAPTGYNMSLQVVNATISEDGETINANPYTVSDIKIRGSIELNKLGEDTNGLPGAEFSLYADSDLNLSMPLRTLTTDSSGIVKFGNVEFGSYKIRETKAPTGYNLNSKVLDATISVEGQIIHANPYTVSDTKIRGNIELKKIGEAENGLSGAEFSLYVDSDTNFTNALMTATSDSSGVVKFSSVVYGSYKIKETKAPTGYNMSLQVVNATISEEGKTINANPYTVSDTKIRGRIDLKKTGEDGKGLPGAVFSLYADSDTNFLTTLKTATSDGSGVVQFSGVEYGSYNIKETKAPIGYNLNSKVSTATIKTDGEVVQATLYEISNTKIRGNIEIHKIGEDGKPLQGVEFKLYKIVDIKFNNPLVTAISDSNGDVKFNSIEYGMYQIKETKALVGYNLFGSSLFATINEDGKTIKVNPYEICNTKITGSIEFNKTGEDGKGLPGAEFSLYEHLDTNFINPLKTAISDNNGLVKFSSVLYGSYKIKETKAPTGYNLSPQVVNATISEDGKTINANPYKVSDIKIRGTINLKKTGEDGKGLPGAEFTLYTDSDTNLTNPLKTATSDSSGVVQFSGVEYGSYNIKETKAPIGYNLNSKVSTATINTNGEVVQANLYEISNTKIRGNIEIKKTGEDGKVLEGTEFSIYTDKDINFADPLAVKTSDGDGKIVFKNLEYGNYVIKETKALEGYILLSDRIEVFVMDDGVTYSYDVKNAKITVTVEVKVTDRKGRKLSNGEVTLYDKAGKAVKTVITDKNGVAKFYNIIYGTYTVKQTKAIDGYILNDEIITVKVDSIETRSVIVEDDQKKVADSTKTGDSMNTFSLIVILGIAILIAISIMLTRKKVEKHN